MKKKLMSILLATFVATSLTACGSKEESNLTTENISTENGDNPNSDEATFEEINIDFNVETAENDNAKVSYPIDEWEYFDEEETAFIFSAKNPATENETSIIMIITDSRASTLEESTKIVLDELEISNPGIEFISEEYTNLGDIPIAYVESKVKVADKVLEQLSIIFEKDGKEIIINGGYYDEAEKDSILKAMKTLAQTVELK